MKHHLDPIIERLNNYSSGKEILTSLDFCQILAVAFAEIKQFDERIDHLYESFNETYEEK